MSSDESKSVNSQASGSGSGERDDREHTHKRLEVFFSLKIDIGTETQTALSKAINYVDLTSLGLSLGKSSTYLTITVFVIVSGAFILQAVSAVFYKQLIVPQPVVNNITQGLMAILLRDLFIPFVTKAITSFDCNSEATVNDAGQEIT
ncbi:MAG: hypothetical protein EZS28_024061, partial [Streblomastix strix]